MTSNSYDISIHGLEFKFRGDHLDGGTTLWRPALKLIPAHILLTIAIIVVAFITAWTTRGIRRVSDLSVCAIMAIGMSAACILYFGAANATLVGVGINNRDELSCDAITRTLVLAYVCLKGYVGMFLARKLYELCENVRTLKGRRRHVKRPYWSLFGPLTAGYLGIVVLMYIFLRTSIWHTGHVDSSGKFVPTDSYCIIHLKNATTVILMLIGYLSFGTLTLSLIFNGRLSVLGLLTFDDRSARASIGCIITALGPIATSTYSLLRGGREVAAVILVFNFVDVMISLVVVWFVEGSWDEGRYNACLCDVPVVDVAKVGKEEVGKETNVGMQSRIARMARVRKLHERMRREEELDSEDEEGEEGEELGERAKMAGEVRVD